MSLKKKKQITIFFIFFGLYLGVPIGAQICIRWLYENVCQLWTYDLKALENVRKRLHVEKIIACLMIKNELLNILKKLSNLTAFFFAKPDSGIF